MRLQVVSLPHTQTLRRYAACAYTQKVRKFCDMMSQLSHSVFLYAGPENEAQCVEHIPTALDPLPPEDYNFATWNVNCALWQNFNARTIEAMKPRAQPGDFICLIGGNCQHPIVRAFPDHVVIEFGIGYQGIMRETFHVWESYTWQAAVLGEIYGAYRANGEANDVVIPNYFELSDFPFSEKRGDYFLYIGRLNSRKGVEIAEAACRRLGAKLILAGSPGDYVPKYGEHVGLVGPETRAELMSRALGVFVPTLYLEPFGGAAAEAMLAGVQPITSDWGAFVEYVDPSYRCHVIPEFADAARRSAEQTAVHRVRMRTIAQSIFSTHKCAALYHEYFQRLRTSQEKASTSAMR
jgi:glycosyltransferase involved in cell wall biosynthesis